MGRTLTRKLGPAGRRELVRLIIDDGYDRRGRRPPPSRSRRRRRIGGRALAGGQRASGVGRVGAGSLEPAASFAARTPARDRAAGLRGARAHGLGAAVDRRRDRGRALDRSCDPAPPRLLARAARGRARSSALRVAVPGRSAAHGRQALPALRRPGHAVTGDRTRTGAEKRQRSATTTSTPSSTTTPAWLTASCSTTSAPRTVTAFVKRALAWFAERGITTRRVMTDGAWSYTHNRACASSSPSATSATSSRRPTRRAGTGRSSASTRPWNASGPRACATATTARNQALPHWLEHYNERRPHSSLGGQPPISRAHNLSGQDS